MMIDEELLKLSRENLARIRADIQRQEELAVGDIERYGYGDREYAQQRWNEFHMTVEPMRLEMEAVLKLMVDYYALQPLPQMSMPIDLLNQINANQATS
jgi:hypothetical protein